MVALEGRPVRPQEKPSKAHSAAGPPSALSKLRHKALGHSAKGPVGLKPYIPPAPWMPPAQPRPASGGGSGGGSGSGSSGCGSRLHSQLDSRPFNHRAGGQGGSFTNRPPTPAPLPSGLSSLGARPQVLAGQEGHRMAVPGAPPPLKKPRLDPSGRALLQGCGPSMRRTLPRPGEAPPPPRAPPKPSPTAGKTSPGAQLPRQVTHSLESQLLAAGVSTAPKLKPSSSFRGPGSTPTSATAATATAAAAGPAGHLPRRPS
ncbi:hypothetical protein T492DRAFT_960157 [Pavlovales sp. CCMP2436]|nr:hypothetical protein T492DRAFT_960157 [Pavlovales sp. CCMP2436]